MISDSLSRRYALALFKLSVEKGELDNVNDEFGVISELVSSKENFRYFLISPKVDIEQKKKVLKSIFGDHISKHLLHFLYLLLDKKRQTLIEKIRSNFVTLFNNHYNKAEITVRPAISLGDEIINDLKKVFEKKLEKTIAVQEEVDPSLIGGVQVRVNNTVYDASVKTKLEKLRKVLATG